MEHKVIIIIIIIISIRHTDPIAKRKQFKAQTTKKTMYLHRTIHFDRQSPAQAHTNTHTCTHAHTKTHNHTHTHNLLQIAVLGEYG